MFCQSAALAYFMDFLDLFIIPLRKMIKERRDGTQILLLLTTF